MFRLVTTALLVYTVAGDGVGHHGAHHGHHGAHHGDHGAVHHTDHGAGHHTAHAVHTAPVTHAVHSAPVHHAVHTAPVTHAVHSAPAAHHVVHTAPATHAVHATHGAHVNLGTHQVGGVVKVAPVNPVHVVHSAPVVQTHAVHNVQPVHGHFSVQADHHQVHHAPNTIVNTPAVVKSQQTIADLVATNPKFTTLLAAVQAADLVDVLAQPGPYTVFAPTNTAFDKVTIV